jgi:CheY-like chemotaxis protein
MAGKRVLVVDDELPVREMMVNLLHHLGCDCESVSSAAEALSKSEANNFDLFLIDFHMPGMTGDQLAREIKERKPGAPVVLITGDHAQSASKDIDRVLFKPVSLAELRTLIASLGS